jgi:hypothetical protein
MANYNQLAYALSTVIDGVKAHDLPDMLGLDQPTCNRIFEIAQEAKAEVCGKSHEYFSLQPSYYGKFEVFNLEGERYMRLESEGGSHSWYLWDDAADAFKSLDNFGTLHLCRKLDDSYQNYNL